MKTNYADMDLLEEIHAVRDELSRRFPTAKAFGDHVRKMHHYFSEHSPPARGGASMPKQEIVFPISIFH